MADYQKWIDELLGGGVTADVGLGKEYISKKYEELWPELMEKMYSELPAGGIYSGALPYSVRKMATEWGQSKLGEEVALDKYSAERKQASMEAGLGYGLQRQTQEESMAYQYKSLAQQNEQYLKSLAEERYYWDEYEDLAKELAEITKETAKESKNTIWDYLGAGVGQGVGTLLGSLIL